MMRRLLLALLLVLVVLAAALAALPWLAGPGLRLGLRVAGFEDIAFEEVRLGLDRLEVTRLALGAPNGQEVGRLEMRYRPGELLRGRVRSIALEDVVVRGEITGEGLRLAGIEADGGEAELPGLPLPEELLIRDARLELQTPAGLLIVPVRAELRPQGDVARFALRIEQVRLAETAATVRADLELEGLVPLPRPNLAELVAEGNLQLAAEGLDVPELGRGIEGSGTIALSLAEGTLRAQTSDLDATISALGEDLAALATALPAPWHVQIGSPAHPLELTATRTEDGALAEVQGPALLAADGPRLEAALAAGFALGDDLAVREVHPRRAALAVEDLLWDGFRIASADLMLEADGPLSDLDGTLQVRLEGDDELAPGLRTAGLALEGTLAVGLVPERLTLGLEPGGTLRLDALTLENRLRTGAIGAQLQAAEQPLLSAELEDGRIGDWTHALAATVRADTIALTAGEKPVELGAAIERLSLTLGGTGHQLTGGNVQITGGRARLPERQLTLQGIATEVAFDAEGLAPEQVVPVSIATITHQAEPAWFRPLSLEARLRPGPERIAFEGRLSTADGRVELAAEGVHEPASGRGQAAIDVPSVTFRPGGLQPDDLAPVIGDALQQVSGELALDGELAWGPDQVTSDIALLLNGLALTTGPARLERVNGLVLFDQIWPLRTPPEQQLGIGLVDIGLPLTNGLVTFQIEPGPELDVAELRFGWAGGTVRAEPFTVRSGADGLSLTLRAEQLDLARIFEQVRLPGVTGEGTIEGTLPVLIEGSEAVISGGELVSTGPGRLSYRPGEAPQAFEAGGESMDLLLQALENFHYEELRITLDGRTDADMDIGLHISGANPELYEGHPIEFNLNLEGELANILRAGLTSYQIPERIRERMQGFRR